MKKKLKIISIMIGLFIIASSITLSTPNINAKSKDTKKPTLSLKVNSTKVTNKSITITYKATDSSNIKVVKWAKGKKSVDYFAKKGTKLKLNNENTVKVLVKTNATYTFYAMDKAGNNQIKTIKISNIDKVKPTINISYSTTELTNKTVEISATVLDDSSGIRKVEYLLGEKSSSDFLDENAKIRPVEILIIHDVGNIKVTQNSTYTILVTDQAGNKTLQVAKVNNIDLVAPELNLSYSVMNHIATINFSATDDNSKIAKIQYLKGSEMKPSNQKWTSAALDITTAESIAVETSGIYSVMVTDEAGNATIESISVDMELKAVWISYLEFSKQGYTEEAFKNLINSMFDNVVKLNMNAVVVQVRPFSDAMYPSSYFPWSTYVSGTQGKDPGYDPLAYMVTAAHERGLEFHAWLNPYRVTLTKEEYIKLSSDNPAKKWLEDSILTNDRNVLLFSSKYYYNPASTEVQNLILNGVEEIIRNYNVDGIHFDDYFYPTLGDKYKSNFDSVEYYEYVEDSINMNRTPETIANWRRKNVNRLIKDVYSVIKQYDSSIRFGISPAGNIDNLLSDKGNYIDIKKWLSSSDYIDYICPQIYWSFDHPTSPFDKSLDRWLSLRTSNTVSMYVGIANYKAGANVYGDSGWKENDDVLKKGIQYSRSTDQVDGYMFFRYAHFFNKIAQPEVENLMDILK